MTTISISQNIMSHVSKNAAFLEILDGKVAFQLKNRQKLFQTNTMPVMNQVEIGMRSPRRIFE